MGLFLPWKHPASSRIRGQTGPLTGLLGEEGDKFILSGATAHQHSSTGTDTPQAPKGMGGSN